MNSARGQSWVDQARKELVHSALPDSGWSYCQHGLPSVEPTALACLSLLATVHDSRDNTAATVLVNASRWIAKIQQPNGSVGVSEQISTPEWPTTYAILIWSNLEGWSAEAAKACKWLVRRTGVSVPDPRHIYGQDATIKGWPWLAGTHSWLEPTAMAVVALRKAGMPAHVRTSDGLNLIRDRAIATGGWNYGNNAIYGTTLRPQPAPTGLALLALSGTEVRHDVVAKACDYLTKVLPGVRSPQSLCWGLLGLTAWGRRPPESEQWLREAFDQTMRRGSPAIELAYLLLAAGERSLHLLGAQRSQGE